MGSGDDGGDMSGQFRGRMVPRGRHWVGKGLLLLKRSFPVFLMKIKKMKKMMMMMTVWMRFDVVL